MALLDSSPNDYDQHSFSDPVILRDSMPNRLARELSPYLLQHAENPVDWYAWGEEAFAAARDADRPIFLSIGYSTCHWCHVMEHESFENADVAALLNRSFVPIKVDREERPDVDRVYMAFVQATTGSGGWPMRVWLTPDLKPFFAGTYFPPTSRYGRPGFLEVLARMAELWANDRERLVHSADELLKRLREARANEHIDSASKERRVAAVETLAEGSAEFEQTFDWTYGGFGKAPKFPRPSELMFLLREHVRTGRARPLEMVTRTLEAMAEGGMRDHLGGGFHRYSVDAEWRIPHFEKMLYDQAQLTVAYLEAGQVTGDRRFFEVARDTLAYVARDLTGAEGGFLSAEDADSLPPEQVGKPDARPVEGAFYLWSRDELDGVLGDEAALVARRFGVEKGGNARHDPTGELAGLNQLYLARSIEALAGEHGASVDEVADRLERAEAKLVARRAERPRPHLDDKVLAAWNGLMIAAAARAAFVLDENGDSARRMAERAARFVREKLWDDSRQVLRRRFRNGQSSIDGYCEDYACMIWGLLELFQTTGEVEWLAWARQLQRRQDELFWDHDGAGWFSTTGADRSVLLRVKDDYDGAEPSAGSVSVLNLLTFLHLEGDDTNRQRIEAALARFGPRLGRAARVVPLMTVALSAYHRGLSQVVVVGPTERDDTMALRRSVASQFLPAAVRLVVEPGSQQEALAAELPFIAPMAMRGGRATAFVCEGFTCREPVTDPDALQAQLRSLTGPAGRAPRERSDAGEERS